MTADRQGLSGQAFALGFQQRQQVLENSLMQRRMKLAEDLQDAKVTSDYKKQEGFAAIASVMSEIAANDGYADAKWQAKFWETASRFPQALDDPSIQGFIGQFKSAEHARLQSELAWTRAEAARERDYNRLMATGMTVQGRENVANIQAQSRERIAGLKGAFGTNSEVTEIVNNPITGEPEGYKVFLGGRQQYIPYKKDLTFSEKTEAGIIRHQLNAYQDALVKLQAQPQDEETDKQIKAIQQQMANAQVKFRSFFRPSTPVPVPVPTTPPATQPFTVPPRTGVVAPTNVNEIVAPPIGVPANATGIELSEELAAEYLKKAGGDVQKARKMARDDGYFF